MGGRGVFSPLSALSMSLSVTGLACLSASLISFLYGGCFLFCQISNFILFGFKVFVDVVPVNDVG